MPYEKDFRPRYLILAILLLLPLGLAACAGKSMGGATSAPMGAASEDQTITARVKTTLLNDTQVNATKIDVSSSNGVVTLSGTVKSKAEADRAVQLARQVSGVKSSLQVAGSQFNSTLRS
jgi:hyperosmotically inducible protein